MASTWVIQLESEAQAIPKLVTTFVSARYNSEAFDWNVQAVFRIGKAREFISALI